MPISPDSDDALRAFIQQVLRSDRVAIQARRQGALPAGEHIAHGADTVTFTASATSAVKTVTHGLGTAPTAVLAMNSGGNAVFHVATAIGATTFGIIGYAPFGAWSGTFPFTWIAIG